MKKYLRSNIWQITMAVAIVAMSLGGLMPHDAMAAVPFVALSTSAFPVNPELTAIAIAFKNPDAALIADQVLPRVPTPKKFTYSVYSAAQSYTIPDTKVGRKSEPNMVDFGGTLTPAETLDYGLDDLIPNDEIEAWNSMPKGGSGAPPSPQAISTMMLTHLVHLDREIRVASLIQTAANYAAANQTTLSGTSQWNDFVNSNPLNAILAALDVPLVRPNSLVLGQAVWTQLRQHPKIVQAIGKSAQTAGNATRQEVADLLELNQILVGGGFYNTAKRGQTPSFARCWGKHASLLHIDSLASQMGQPTFGWTAQWGTKIAGEIPEPKKGLRGGVDVRVGESVVEVITSQDAGYIFQNAVA